MLFSPAGRMAATVALMAAVAGCSATRYGKCKDCQTEVYPAQPCYECAEAQVYGSPAPYPQPAPMPSAEPLPSPVDGLDQVPPPPPEAVRARPLNQISATARDLYGSASQAVRARFTR